VVNAYDNTILYTDHILASVIDILKKHQDHISGAMIYMSDHGESLGENGLFLHGAPYSIAPPQQTHIPMIAWFSDDYQKRMGLDRSCIVKNAANAYSHDNLFHTVLGMMDIRTSVYRPELDIYHSCRIVRQG
jgi:lipid A ethanolaminephosphotransferase